MSPLLIILTSALLTHGQESEEAPPAPENSLSATNETDASQENFEFPEPHLQVELMVEAAKDFIRKYLTAKKWHALKRLLQTVREIGGTRKDGWRTVSVFMARVLTSDQKKEIMSRREELDKIFGKEIGIPTKKKIH